MKPGQPVDLVGDTDAKSRCQMMVAIHPKQ